MRRPGAFNSTAALVIAALAGLAASACADVIGQAIDEDIEAVTDTSLSGLVLSSGALSPAFAAETTSYAAIIGVGSITVRPTSSQPERVISVRMNGGSWNGTVSGSPSASLDLAYGENLVEIRVAMASGTGATTYSVVAYRQSDDTRLSALSLSSGELSPAFDPAGLEYEHYVENSVASTSVTLTVAEAHAAAELRVNGGAWLAATSGIASIPLAIKEGRNLLEARVTAENGGQRVYGVGVNRHSKNAELAALEIGGGSLVPAFASAVEEYRVTIANAVEYVLVRPTALMSTSTIQMQVGEGAWSAIASGSVSSPLAMAIGDNRIKLMVTAEDMSSNTYRLVVHRIDNDPSLVALALDAGALAGFAPAVLEYDATVAQPSVRVKPTMKSACASAQARVSPGAWVAVPSGAESAALPLAYGAGNRIEVLVTAEDGATTRTYAITVYRKCDIADLSSLAFSVGDLSPAFAAGTTEYALDVPHASTSTTFTPKVAETHETLRYRLDASAWTAIASGSSAELALPAPGLYALAVEATAEDGTTKTYKATVHRNAPASLEVILSPDLPTDPTSVAFSWSGATATIQRGSAMSVSATISTAAAPTSWRWLVDGVEVGTASAALFGADLPSGHHTLTLVVGLGSQLFSGTRDFTVVSP